MNHVAELERRFLPLFDEAKERFAIEYPEYRFEILSYAIGSRTALQGHNLGIECWFPDATDQEADCVAAQICATHLTSDPKMCDADVSWGSGVHPDIDMELLPSPLAFGEATFAHVATQIPALLVVFRQAIDAWKNGHL